MFSKISTPLNLNDVEELLNSKSAAINKQEFIGQLLTQHGESIKAFIKNFDDLLKLVAFLPNLAPQDIPWAMTFISDPKKLKKFLARLPELEEDQFITKLATDHIKLIQGFIETLADLGDFVTRIPEPADRDNFASQLAIKQIRWVNDLIRNTFHLKTFLEWIPYDKRDNFATKNIPVLVSLINNFSTPSKAHALAALIRFLPSLSQFPFFSKLTTDYIELIKSFKKLDDLREFIKLIPGLRMPILNLMIGGQEKFVIELVTNHMGLIKTLINNFADLEEFLALLPSSTKDTFTNELATHHVQWVDTLIQSPSHLEKFLQWIPYDERLNFATNNVVLLVSSVSSLSPIVKVCALVAFLPECQLSPQCGHA